METVNFPAWLQGLAGEKRSRRIYVHPDMAAAALLPAKAMGRPATPMGKGYPVTFCSLMAFPVAAVAAQAGWQRRPAALVPLFSG